MESDLIMQQRRRSICQITDLISEGGYDAAIAQLKEATQILVYLIADAQHHRPEGRDLFQFDGLNLTGDSPLAAYEGIGSVLKEYAPVILDTVAEHEQPEFITTPEQNEALTDEQTANIIIQVESLLEAIDEAIYKLSMITDPTASQIAQLYVEMARYQNIQMAHERAIRESLVAPSSPRKTAVDYFGVGQQLAVFLANVVSIRTFEYTEQVSLPPNLSAEAMLEGFFAAVAIVGRDALFRFPSGSYDTPGSHRTANCTLSAGRPYHAPERLCFDHRQVDGLSTNAELLRDYLKHNGASEPTMEFADRVTELALEIVSSEGMTPVAAMLELIRSSADTDCLAMSAAMIYLEGMCPPPECIRSWRFANEEN